MLLALSGVVSLFTGGRRVMASSRDEPDAGPAWLAAIIVFSAFVLASALMLPPGGTLVDMSESLKDWHASSFGEPPIAGAAKMSPTELAKRLSLDPAKALINLASHNVKLSSPDATVAEIARENGLAPAAVYETLRGGKEPKLPAPAPAEIAEVQTAPQPPQLPVDPPPGLGRLKLTDVCEQYGLNLNKAVDTLAKAGIKASGDLTLRQIAQRNLILPIEVYDTLRGTPQLPPAPAALTGSSQATSGQPSVPGQQAQPEAQSTPGQLSPSAQSPQNPVQPVPGQPVQPSVSGQAQPVSPAMPQLQIPPQPSPESVPQVSQPAIAAPEGLEHMTLAAFCRDHNLDTAQSLARLKAKGIVAFSDMTFRELAIENNLTAEQVMELMVK
jgi:hypothetical protein